MTTSIWSARTPNSQCASITSRPLFISVAESIVIFAPHPPGRMAQRVGCGDVRQLESRRPRNGPPDAVRISRRISAAAPAVQALMNGVVLAVDRQDGHPVRRAASVTRPPAITRTSLFASAIVLPASMAASTASSAVGPRRRAQHEIDVRDATPRPSAPRRPRATSDAHMPPSASQPRHRSAIATVAMPRTVVARPARRAGAFSPAARATTCRRSGCASTTASALCRSTRRSEDGDARVCIWSH